MSDQSHIQSVNQLKTHLSTQNESIILKIYQTFKEKSRFGREEKESKISCIKNLFERLLEKNEYIKILQSCIENGIYQYFIYTKKNIQIYIIAEGENKPMMQTYQNGRLITQTQNSQNNFIQQINEQQFIKEEKQQQNTNQSQFKQKEQEQNFECENDGTSLYDVSSRETPKINQLHNFQTHQIQENLSKNTHLNYGSQSIQDKNDLNFKKNQATNNDNQRQNVHYEKQINYHQYQQFSGNLSKEFLKTNINNNKNNNNNDINIGISSINFLNCTKDTRNTQNLQTTLNIQAQQTQKPKGISQAKILKNKLNQSLQENSFSTYQGQVQNSVQSSQSVDKVYDNKPFFSMNFDQETVSIRDLQDKLNQANKIIQEQKSKIQQLELENIDLSNRLVYFENQDHNLYRPNQIQKDSLGNNTLVTVNQKDQSNELGKKIQFQDQSNNFQDKNILQQGKINVQNNNSNNKENGSPSNVQYSASTDDQSNFIRFHNSQLLSNKNKQNINQTQPEVNQQNNNSKIQQKEQQFENSPIQKYKYKNNQKIVSQSYQNQSQLQTYIKVPNPSQSQQNLYKQNRSLSEFTNQNITNQNFNIDNNNYANKNIQANPYDSNKKIEFNKINAIQLQQDKINQPNLDFLSGKDINFQTPINQNINKVPVLIPNLQTTGQQKQNLSQNKQDNKDEIELDKGKKQYKCFTEIGNNLKQNQKMENSQILDKQIQVNNQNNQNNYRNYRIFTQQTINPNQYLKQEINNDSSKNLNDKQVSDKEQFNQQNAKNKQISETQQNVENQNQKLNNIQEQNQLSRITEMPLSSKEDVIQNNKNQKLVTLR
ncbi:hypothetical protein PPERSA_12148 [Pseudocohnilembus persalinus]|uniref:Uncharacterized protein n=1 Tax=Pseudocohnilembus persalinus TaxID=266149 RepID=A0A0V0QPB2_PSEPJ|nr:hypothetical protein PPERSA_12148 [Pseudocohnilembus persalinus]|eukprot:KRX03943.1 hypothetical protein PPERSA_12148 [Pseudocohnilembus persalinus]